MTSRGNEVVLGGRQGSHQHANHTHTSGLLNHDRRCAVDVVRHLPPLPSTSTPPRRASSCSSWPPARSTAVREPCPSPRCRSCAMQHILPAAWAPPRARTPSTRPPLLASPFGPLSHLEPGSSLFLGRRWRRRRWRRRRRRRRRRHDGRRVALRVADGEALPAAVVQAAPRHLILSRELLVRAEFAARVRLG